MAGLTRWDPFRDLSMLQDEMNRWFDDRYRGRDRETAISRFAPPVDIYEDAEGVSLSVDLPGVEPKAVQVKVEDGTLSIGGERRLEREEKKDAYHRIERTYGSFLRSFSLPPTLDVDRIKAEHKNGVLRVFLPRREETKPRTIAVKVE